jgi:hypothetical protein
MMSFGKFQAALTHFTQETTIAKLADINFDFSLVKVEAPSEFKALGAALSKTRRSDAESGSTHVIARKLGALFQSMLPDTPNLIRAYGQRASDISQSPTVNPQGTKSHGAFQEFVGVDGTSIWAAATSGRGAVAVHLLACMLAFVWSPAQATSIWEELVVERKKELSGKIDSDKFLAEDFGLTQQTVTKEQLLDWDASARAWLRAADGAQLTEKRQRKLMKVVKKVNLPIGSRQQVYRGVTEAWKTALETVDKIIGGIPYSVIRDGAVLAALSAWHLYPDIVVLGSQNEEILQHDDLIALGGIVTIGLSGSDSEHGNGVYWSLSLAHLRYYGPPVMASRSINSDSGRMSIMEFTQTILGAVIGSWGLERREIGEAMDLLVLIEKIIRTEIELQPLSAIRTSLMNTSWINFLAGAVATFRNSTNDDRKSCEKSVYRGYRHFGFLANRKCSPLDFDRLQVVSLMRNIEDKIVFLRSQALRISPPPSADSLLIRIRNKAEHNHPSYLSAIPFPGQGTSPAQHCRWLLRLGGHEIVDGEDIMKYEPKDIQVFTSGTNFIWKNAPWQFSPHFRGRDTEQGMSAPATKTRPWGLKTRKKEHQQQSLPANDIEFQFIAGDLDDVALFERVQSRQDLGQSDTYDRFPRLSIAEINNLIKEGVFGRRLIVHHLSCLNRQEDQKQLFDSLRALASCAKIYENLPGATISPEIITRDIPIGKARWAVASQETEEEARGLKEGWADGFETLLPSSLSRPSAFAAICILDTGILDIDPAYLNDVMAISSGDSLYIAAPLLCDPATDLQPSDIRRVIGNIGRAGLALLIPPKNPEIRLPDPNMWKVINHDNFEGKLEDCFPNTSLHLSFTGYVLPVVVGDHGGRFVEAFYIESKISVHDSGKWVADIDPLGALLSPKFNAIVQQPHCESKPTGHKPDFEVTSIENWEELLDPPKNAAVIKVHGNWQARLAATAVSVGLGHQTIIFQGHGCWDCGRKTLQLLEKEEQEGSKVCEPIDLDRLGVPSSGREEFVVESSAVVKTSNFIFIL